MSELSGVVKAEEGQIKFTLKRSKYQPIILRADQISQTSASGAETNKCLLLLCRRSECENRMHNQEKTRLRYRLQAQQRAAYSAPLSTFILAL